MCVLQDGAGGEVEEDIEPEEHEGKCRHCD